MIFTIAAIAQIIINIVLIVLSTQLRTPSLASIRDIILVVLLLGSSLLILSGCLQLRQKTWNLQKGMAFAIAFLGVVGLTITVANEAQFYWQKYRVVLGAEVESLEVFGKHFIVGYKDINDAVKLVEKRAIAGVFITTRNIENKTYEEIKTELETLQEIRRSQGLSPLWIATDQEGGIVSRLSPPLTYLPSLSEIVAKEKNIENIKKAVIEYASTQGRELSDLGINVNFAPVVDLNKGVVNQRDRYSQIYRRAISDDSEIVTLVAKWYCSTLVQFDVKCTIKHFPGLGRVENDTHVADAELNASVEELEQDDWIPFREIMKDSSAWTMLGHAKLMALDTQHPVSFSPPVIRGLIREKWQYRGILITDDLCMKAVYGSSEGINGAIKKALISGVDLLLIAYDPDLYYEAMASLLQGHRLQPTGTR
ncbi:glycoside hydrolase family 3 N-terminal domain-containing protein [Spirulina sp. 06S082]|uniref:glycoside hydrolase family 3 N-terminal domain-containing protein n=1 Tax=Spirulina sp. 06S082 TaxID=3110248 RepID=UPI002B1E995A|nr:glycoside hydrolase family 3 N-terminal domain-containing protein [Spirulina sp. 06S082]MEA5472207.1 glycoside hydrolase family 3 N-terminal domain-containing protein [Spirulina sp. 06S082]